MITLLLAGLVPPATAAPAPLVPRDPTVREVRTVVPVPPGRVSAEAFVDAVMDCDHYPTDARYMGNRPLIACHTLETTSDGWSIVHLRTGGNAIVAERQAVLAMRVVENSAARVRVEWDLVAFGGASGAWTGRFSDTPNTWPDAVYTPANAGSWDYDLLARTITYAVQVDVGGSVPKFVVSEASVLAFPLRFLDVRLDLKP